MIRSSFFGLEIGRSGLTTAQFGLEVTGHNIANVDTAGFTRQSVRQASHAPFESVGRYAPTTAAMVGGGTRVQILEQIRSSYLDRRFRSEMTTFSYWNTRSESLSSVVSFFDSANESTSINHAMAEFFRSMKITTNDPVAGAPRVLMRTSAEDLVQMLRMNHDGLVALQESENRAVVTKVGEVNRRLENIRQLNTQIYNFEVTGLIANDLRDRRNLELDELSRLIDIDWEEREDQFGHGVFSLTIAGETAVNHDRRMTMSIGWMDNAIQGINTMVAIPVWAEYMPREFDPARSAPFPFSSANDPSVPRWDEANMDMDAWQAEMQRYMWSVQAAAVDMRRISGGEIKAHMDVRDGTGDVPDSRSRGIPYYIEMINDLTRALFQEINNQHVQGWTDNALGSQTGVKFFTATNPITGAPIGRVIFRDEDGDIIGDDVDHTDPSINHALTEFRDAAGNLITDPDVHAGDLRVATIYFFSAPGAPIGFNAGSAHPDAASAEFYVSAEELHFITAINFDVSQAVLANEYNIAASSARIGRVEGDSTELQRGNNINMNALYSLFGETGITVRVTGPDGVERTREIGTFDDYGTIIRLDIANTLHTSNNNVTTSRLLTLAAGNQRAAIAGVSLDEEMVGLVRFQHAYNGAARVITAIDEALERLINGTGRVGL